MGTPATAYIAYGVYVPEDKTRELVLDYDKSVHSWCYENYPDVECHSIDPCYNGHGVVFCLPETERRCWIDPVSVGELSVSDADKQAMHQFTTENRLPDASWLLFYTIEC